MKSAFEMVVSVALVVGGWLLVNLVEIIIDADGVNYGWILQGVFFSAPLMFYLLGRAHSALGA